MKSKIEILQCMNEILDARRQGRVELVKEFQNGIWNDESIEDEGLNEILSQLAYDLDFYEPDNEWRKESPNYYGDERLEALVKAGIEKLNNTKKPRSSGKFIIKVHTFWFVSFCIA